MTPEKIAEKCLTKFWGKGPDGRTSDDNGYGWDAGSPAHKFSIAWAKRNIKRFKRLTWKQIYTEYLISIRQE
jgi:hypothetical protein